MGSQSGQENQKDNERFQEGVKEPVGTESHQTLSKRLGECRRLIGHKKSFVLLCPIGRYYLCQIM